MSYWKPNTTVAAVVRHEGRFLLVEEHTRAGLRINQPAGHLDPGESLEQGAVRETLEETAYRVEPVSLIGVYMARYRPSVPRDEAEADVTYLRYAFECRLVGHEPQRALDEGIVRALWLTEDELLAAAPRHRSPLVLRTVEDYLAGRRFPLDLIHTDPSCFAPPELPSAPTGDARGDPRGEERCDG